MHNSIKNVVWACLLIIPFIALHVADGGRFDVLSWFGGAGMFFPFISGKNIIFRVLVEIAFAGWAILALSDSHYRINIKKSPIMIAYSLFMLVLLVADLFGVDREKSMWSNFERMEGFVGHIHFFAYFFVLTVMVRTVADWQKVWKAFIVADVLVLVYGFSQLLGVKGLFFANLFPKMSLWFSEKFPIHQSINRVDATVGNSAYFGVFCLMYVFIALLMWSQTKDPKKSYWYPGLIVVNSIGVFYSGTRGSIIGLAVGIFITLGILAFKQKGRIRNFFVLAVVVATIGIGALFSFKDASFIKSSPTLYRLASISSGDITTASRFAIWQISYEAWKERPILGYGQDNFSYIFARKFLPAKMCNLEPWYDRSHDVFFDWLVAAGALGLITYLSLYGVTLWFMWKKENALSLREKAILTGAIAGYFIHNIFVFDNLTSYILFFALLAYITTQTKAGGEHHGKTLFDKDQMNLLVVPLIGVLLLVTVYYVNIRPVIVNRLVINAMTVVQSSQPIPFAEKVKIAQNSFTEAIAMNTLGSLEAKEQFLQLAVRVGQIKIPDTLAQGDKQAAAEALGNFLKTANQEIIDSYPSYKDDVRMLSIYGMFYNGVGDAVSAERVLTSAHMLAPNKQLITFDLMRAQLIGKQFKEAYDLGKETYDLSATCRDALKWYMVSAAYAGKYAEAKAYALSKGQDPGVDPDVIGGVIASGQTALGIELLIQAKKQNPALTSEVDALIKQLLAKKR